MLEEIGESPILSRNGESFLFRNSQSDTRPSGDRENLRSLGVVKTRALCSRLPGFRQEGEPVKQQPSWRIWLLRSHLFLGILVSLPVLAWSISGFFLALPPGAVTGEPYQAIEASQVVVSPAEALSLLAKHLKTDPQVTSLGLEQRGGHPRYSAFGQQGAFKIDAVTGVISKPEGPSAKTRLVRHAHFFNFAGSGRTYLLLLCALLSSVSTLSGIVLLLSRPWYAMKF